MARLRFTIQGAPRQVSVDSFIEVVQKTIGLLRELDQAISHQRRGTLQWIVTDLGMGSAYIETESRITRGDEDYSTIIARYYSEGIHTLETEGVTPPYFSYDSLTRLRSIVGSFGTNGITGYTVKVVENGSEASLTREAEKNLQNLIGTKYKSKSAVEGRIELISIHRRTRRFNVYHPVTQRAVRCTLPEELEAGVVAALGSRVIATGTVSYNAKNEPIRVDVQRLRILQREEDLPSIQDILGSIPNLTEGLTTKEHLQRLHGD